VTALAFPDNEATSFYIGTEEGTVFGANRYDRAGAKAGLAPGEVYRGHSGGVTGLHFHPLAGPVDFSDLFLTCGVDWTVKLWRARGQTQVPPPAATTTGAAPALPAVHPIYSFEEADDYVFDVRWHPAHPAVFGTVDGAGKFDVWNLNTDTEVRHASLVLDLLSSQTRNAQVPASTTLVAPDAPKGLNKLAWDRRDGRRAALGSSDGRVHVYDVGALAVPAENEWEATRKTVAALMADATASSAAAGGDGARVGR
jgi:dynein intermediate chain